MKRKVISLILALTLVFALVGCGGKTEAPASAAPSSAAPAANASAAPSAAPAKTFPTEDITILSCSAGATPDVAVRQLATKMSEILGVNVIIQNGEATFITQLRDLLHEKPDGYTIAVSNTSSIISDVMGQVEFNVVDSFDNVAVWAMGGQFALCVRGDSPFNTYEELLAYTQEHPGELIISDSLGSNTNVLCTALRNHGLDVSTADVGQSQARLTALMSGTIDIFLSGFAAINQYCDTGEAKCLLIADNERCDLAPDVPCAAELGYDDVDFDSVVYFSAPKGTDPEALQVLIDCIEQACADPELQQEIKDSANYTAYFVGGEEGKAVLQQKRDLAIEMGIGTGEH